jgi:small-conductance mechanosensitive channel
MDNPWVEWWQNIQHQWRMLNSSVVRGQLLALGAALLVALIVDRLLERYRQRVVGSPQEHRLRTILWAAKFPALALIFGYLALSIYSATGRPSYTLHKLITLFWFLLAYALIAKAVVVLLPTGDARQVIRRILLPSLAVLAVLHLLGLLTVFWAWAARPAVTVGSGTITLANIGTALSLVLLFYLAARGGKYLFLHSVLPRTETDPNLAQSVAGFVQFTIIVIGVWIAIASLGLQLSNLTLFVSALTVGIGFGLQDVIKNVMGGLILLGEGHVLPNEVFQISGETGTIERIGLRSTTLRTFGGSQVIIPNADLITEKVSDLTGSMRIEIQVGVSVTSDIHQAEQALLGLAQDHPAIRQDPEPVVYFSNLGESTYDLKLYCWVHDRSLLLRTRSDLLFAIVETFDREGIEMPFRQLDVHLHSQGGAPTGAP